MQTEVTQRLWKQVMGTNPSYNQNCDECPVENVTWDMVQNFIEKLNQKTGKKYRLPSEAEWEFAARGGNKSQGYKYAGSNILEEVGWFDQSGDGKTHPVSQKKHNELELYDMSGNVWEWCNDWYDSTYYYNTPIDNPIGPSKLPNTCRVYRGGCWSSKSHSCKVSSRLIYTNRINYKLIGFRLALSAEHGR
jgi:formylglycine-generating enzyme required for sulfatase activity